MDVKRGLIILCFSLVVLSLASFVSAATCSDSDNGKNYYSYGTTCISGGSCYPDKCTTSTQVKEFYCGDDGKVAVALFTCSTLCSGGKCACIDYYADADNDGYGDVSDKKCLYAIEGNYKVTQTGDCNDADSNINSGKTEICNDGIDNDCDLIVDEGCAIPEQVEETPSETEEGTTDNEEAGPSDSLTPPPVSANYVPPPNFDTAGGDELRQCTNIANGVKLTFFFEGSGFFNDYYYDICSGNNVLERSCSGDLETSPIEATLKTCTYGCEVVDGVGQCRSSYFDTCGTDESCTSWVNQNARGCAVQCQPKCADTCTSSETCLNWINIGTKCCAVQCQPNTAPPPAPATIACTQDCNAILAPETSKVCNILGNVAGTKYFCDTTVGECRAKTFAGVVEICTHGCEMDYVTEITGPGSTLSYYKGKCKPGLPDNSGCAFNSQCASNHCVQFECGLRDVGESCTFNIDCANGLNCKGGVCGGLAYGQGCLLDYACASNSCKWFTCR